MTALNYDMMAGVKAAIDPKNIFAINNTIYRSQAEEKRDHELDAQFKK